MPSRILREGILTSERVAIAHARKGGYNGRKSYAKKAQAGLENPLQFAAMSRTRTGSGFFHGTSYGGADGRRKPAGFRSASCPVLNPSALPPVLRSCRQSSNATLGADHG